MNDKGEIFMEKKKIFKIILIILLAVIVMFLIHTVRNYIIITDLQDKISKYSDGTNYHIKSTSTTKEGARVEMEYYKKDNKQVVFMERDLNEENLKMSMYDNGERIDIFYENADGKSCDINAQTSSMQINLYNFLENDTKWQTFISSAMARVKSIQYNGKKCYAIKEFLSTTSLTSEDSEIIIDKETGLFLKSTETDDIVEREYEFNNVDDSIFAEPDISQYKVMGK